MIELHHLLQRVSEEPHENIVLSDEVEPILISLIVEKTLEILDEEDILTYKNKKETIHPKALG